MQRKALITGITGQDGSYLAEHLLDLGYEVHGIVRRVALEEDFRLSRIAHLLDSITLHSATLESYPSIFSVLNRVRPGECYHLAAQTYVPESFADSFSTMSANIFGSHYVFEAVRALKLDTRIYFAATSEMFGQVTEVPQTENTRFRPRSPYGVSKLAAYELARNYREAYGMFISCGILFNHESPRRGPEFVTRKISTHAARIKLNQIDRLTLGNLDAKRDWGFAGDYVRAMRLMLAHNRPDDFVVATGEAHTVREFCEVAFCYLGLDYQDYVRSDPGEIRPADVELLVGDPSKAVRELGWEPHIGFYELVRLMVAADYNLLAKGLRILP